MAATAPATGVAVLTAGAVVAAVTAVAAVAVVVVATAKFSK